MNVEIREARKEDCKAIYELIQELAVFEKMPNGPKTDHKDLERDGFETDPPLFKAFVVVDNAKIIGHALYYYTYSSWEGKSMFLDDFYISPNYRNEGIGDKVFEAVAKISEDSLSLSWKMKFRLI
ncbi:thialysine N-epsilon-acetyltransferase-like isoform X2 [Venturia canescens]|uniref:thialysine N-epsilon-acetyltransferase-like isoform X2 n=1 Tax=Venturia canescens TaxID=32260 RepID=UPI001C9C4553|nr:thialysine N-epsilon-acetyltransferase-like isoform X2 [Venturia canescens]